MRNYLRGEDCRGEDPYVKGGSFECDAENLDVEVQEEEAEAGVERGPFQQSKIRRLQNRTLFERRRLGNMDLGSLKQLCNRA